jgi:hypothetical protein
LLQTNNVSEPIRQPDGTVRVDPLNNLKKYRGGYNITNKHYWSVTLYLSPIFFSFLSNLFYNLDLILCSRLYLLEFMVIASGCYGFCVGLYMEAFCWQLLFVVKVERVEN